MIWFLWISGIALALIWLVPVIDTALHIHLIADLTKPEWAPPDSIRLPSLTIVVPARNEEHEVEEALRSLLALDYPEIEVIVVNDRSTDTTGAIMERISAAEAGSKQRLRTIHVRELPRRWLGKTHAMWRGAQQANSDWVLFTDADCVFRSDTMRRAMFYAVKNSLDHLVLIPTIHMHSLGERMMIAFPQIAASFIMRPWKVRDQEARDFIGAGAFNLVRREAYNAIGTFAALRLEIVDDLKLGEMIKKARFRQDVVIGRDLVSLRWIRGAMGLVRNLEKNLFAFLRFRLSLVIAACILLLFLNVWPFVGTIIAPGWARAPFAFAVAMIAARYYQGSATIGVPTITFLLNPISAILTGFAILGSAFAAIRNGGVTWRGTKYPLDELRKK
jgi:glycosyltransferase involved in cell wall biosynthesis